MTKTPATRTLFGKVSDLFGLQKAVNDQIGQAKTAAQDAVDQLDAAIREKTEAAAQLTRRVSVADAAAHLAESIRDTLRQSRVDLQRRANSAIHLGAHRPMREIGHVFDGNGASPLRELEARPAQVLSWPIEPTEILALTMTDEQIQAWALQAARSAGAQEDGPGLDQLKAEHERLIDELVELHEQRKQAKEQLAGLVNMALSPLVPDSFFQPKASNEASATSQGPTVTQLDKDGQAVQTVFGHSTQELIGAMSK